MRRGEVHWRPQAGQNARSPISRSASEPIFERSMSRCTNGLRHVFVTARKGISKYTRRSAETAWFMSQTVPRGLRRRWTFGRLGVCWKARAAAFELCLRLGLHRKAHDAGCWDDPIAALEKERSEKRSKMRSGELPPGRRGWSVSRLGGGSGFRSVVAKERPVAQYGWGERSERWALHKVLGGGE